MASFEYNVEDLGLGLQTRLVIEELEFFELFLLNKKGAHRHTKKYVFAMRANYQ